MWAAAMFNHDLCPDKHSPICPGKTRARQFTLGTSNKSAPILTISPGSYDGLQWVGWEGHIYTCDICYPCIKHANRMRRHYKDLQIMRAWHMNVQEATRLLVRWERYSKELVLDMDLAFGVRKAAPILTDVATTLVKARIPTRLLLTYVNHRDGMNTDERLRVLTDALPEGAELAGDPFCYASVWSNEQHKYSKGSSMAVADIRVSM
jgi:hypothetical protein